MPDKEDEHVPPELMELWLALDDVDEPAEATVEKARLLSEMAADVDDH